MSGCVHNNTFTGVLNFFLFLMCDVCCPITCEPHLGNKTRIANSIITVQQKIAEQDHQFKLKFSLGLFVLLVSVCELACRMLHTSSW